MYTLILTALWCISAYYSLPISAAPIRARCVIEPGIRKRWEGLLENRTILDQEGLIFVDNNPDVILCNCVTQDILASNVPIIILEKRGSASLSCKTRKHISNPHVLAVFKNRVLRDKSLDNSKLIECNYALTLLNQQAQLVSGGTKSCLPTKDLKKIQRVLWDFSGSALSQRFTKLSSYDIHEHLTDKKIDVFFAGSAQFDRASDSLNTLYSWHRKKAVTVVNAIENIAAVTLIGRPLPFDEYIETMKQAKIVISPWGSGEWCYRDIEAMHCGAVVIKPDTSFVDAIPDVYQNYETYIPCALDFSDLEEKIRMVLDNFHHYVPLLERAKQRVVSVLEEKKKVVKRFARTVRKVLAQHGT